MVVESDMEDAETGRAAGPDSKGALAPRKTLLLRPSTHEFYDQLLQRPLDLLYAGSGVDVAVDTLSHFCSLRYWNRTPG